MTLTVDTSNTAFNGTYALEMIEEDMVTGKMAVTRLNLTVVQN